MLISRIYVLARRAPNRFKLQQPYISQSWKSRSIAYWLHVQANDKLSCRAEPGGPSLSISVCRLRPRRPLRGQLQRHVRRAPIHIRTTTLALIIVFFNSFILHAGSTRSFRFQATPRIKRPSYINRLPLTDSPKQDQRLQWQPFLKLALGVAFSFSSRAEPTFSLNSLLALLYDPSNVELSCRAEPS